MSGFQNLLQFKLAINDFLKNALANDGYCGMEISHVGEGFLIKTYVKDKPNVIGPLGLRIRMLRNEIQQTFGIDRLSLIVEKYPPYGMCSAALGSHAFYERLGIVGFLPCMSVKWLINHHLNQAMAQFGYRGMKMIRNGERFLIEIYVEDKQTVIGPSGLHLRIWKDIIERRLQSHRFSLRVEQYPPKGLCASSQVSFLQSSFLRDNMKINAMPDLVSICFGSLRFMQMAGALGCEICIRQDSCAYVFTAGMPIVVDTENHPDIDVATTTLELRAFSCLIAVRILRPKISALTTDWDRLGSDWERIAPTFTIYDIVCT